MTSPDPQTVPWMHPAQCVLRTPEAGDQSSSPHGPQPRRPATDVCLLSRETFSLDFLRSHSAGVLSFETSVGLLGLLLSSPNSSALHPLVSPPRPHSTTYLSAS